MDLASVGSAIARIYPHTPTPSQPSCKSRLLGRPEQESNSGHTGLPTSQVEEATERHDRVRGPVAPPPLRFLVAVVAATEFAIVGKVGSFAGWLSPVEAHFLLRGGKRET